MTKEYSDSRFGVEKILTLPLVDLSAAPLTGASIYFTEDITITEIGLIVTTKISGTSTPSLLFKSDTTQIGSLSVTTDTGVGTALRSTTGFTSTGISNTETLSVQTSTTCTTSGIGAPYIKYRERFV